MIIMTERYGQEQAPKIARPTHRGNAPTIGRVPAAPSDSASVRDMATPRVLELAGGAVAVPHEWQEFNEHGNTCHHPGCTLAQDEHSS